MCVGWGRRPNFTVWKLFKPYYYQINLVLRFQADCQPNNMSLKRIIYSVVDAQLAKSFNLEDDNFS